MTAYVYAALASDGILKVGESWTPATRLKQHASAARKRGAALEQTWVWEHALSRHAEGALVQIAHRTGDPAWGREWFKNVNLPEFLACANNFKVDKYGAVKTLTGGDFMKWLVARHPTRSPFFKHIVAADQAGVPVDEYVSVFVLGSVAPCCELDDSRPRRFRCYRATGHPGDHKHESPNFFFSGGELSA